VGTLKEQKAETKKKGRGEKRDSRYEGKKDSTEKQNILSPIPERNVS